ncbi:MAG: RIP metalloprotease RseP [bacterium JZ-2024 1]
MSYLVTFVLIGLLILIHEAGHWFSASRLGVKTLEFSVGFGPLLAQTMRKGMKFSLRAIMFGGFVRLKGLDEEEGKEDPDSFLVQPAWKKVLILVAGPVANFLLALLFFYFIPLFFGETALFPFIAQVFPGSPAEKAGIPANSIILSVNDRTVNSAEIRSIIRNSNGAEISMLIRSKEGDFVYRVKPEKMNLEGAMGWGIGIQLKEVPFLTGIVNWVKPHSRLWQAGLRPGDRILQINDMPLEVFFAQSNSSKQIPLNIEWVDAQQNFHSASLVITEKEYHSLQFQMYKKKVSPISAFSRAGNLIALISGKIGEFFVNLFQGNKEALKQVAGPVGIFAYTLLAYQMGWDVLFLHFASISWVLGLMNLVPIPPLDGGRVILLPLETYRGRKKWTLWLSHMLQAVGIALLLLLILWITFMDIVKIRAGDFFP